MYTSKMIRVQNCSKNVFHNIHVLVNELKKKNSQAKLNEKNGCIHVQKLYEKKNKQINSE